MKNEIARLLPFMAFVTTGLLAARMVLNYNLRLYRAAKHLKEAYSEAGITWEYQNDLAFRKKLLLSPDDILNSDDTENIRKAKQDLICSRMDLKPTLIKGSLIMLGGFVCIVILCFVGFAIHDSP